MDRNRLKAHLDDGLSLETIGAIEGKHPSTVAYWLGKHGLRAGGSSTHSPRGAIEKAALAKLVAQGMTLREIAAAVDRSMTTVRYWIRRHELASPLGVRRADVDAAISEGRQTVVRECRKHGRTVFVIESSRRTRCRRCRIEAVSAWRRRAKAKLVKEAGECCVICGYRKCQAALQFHHLDPKSKEFHLAEGGVTRSIDSLRREVAKCVLLCANCHAEVESGFSVLRIEALPGGLEPPSLD